MTQQRPTTIQELLPADIDDEQDDLRQELAVLDEAEAEKRYQETPVSVICPGCGTVAERFVDGLPSRVAHFEHYCSECEITLYRWCAVALPTALEHQPPVTTLENVVITYFTESIWAGVTTTVDEYPRNQEYTEEFATKASEFGWDWELECPLCRQSLSSLGIDRLDYHHWTHSPDRGVCLCRSCHSALTADKTDTQLDWEAQELGLQNKYDIQIVRLALREQAVVRHDSVSELAQTLHARYNLHLPSMVISDILQQVAAEDVLLDVVDESLFDHLPIERSAILND